MYLFKDKINEDDNLSLPLEIEGGHWDGTFRRFLLIFSFFIVALLVLSAYAPVREVALAQGEIVPVGSIVQVEHLEGGIVDEVMVSSGGEVKAGDVLVKLRTKSGSGDFNQVRVRRDRLEMRRLRLVALLEDGELTFGELKDKYANEARDQQLLFDSERAAVAAAGNVLRARREQRRVDVETRLQEIKSIDAQLEIIDEQLEAQFRLIVNGFSSRANFLDVKSRLEQVKQQKAQLKGAIAAGEASILEIDNEAVQARNARRQEWSDQLLTALAEIAELDERLTTSRDRVERLVITAPKSGRIQSIAAKQPGEVIRPGDVVAEIVPLNSEVEAEVRIDPKDIGHVSVGHAAEITLSTFDPEVFGKVQGELREISPTTFETDEGEKYYKGLVKLARHSLLNNDREFGIVPGMVVTASVTTGSKSVMRYLLKPVVRSYDRAFSER